MASSSDLISELKAIREKAAVYRAADYGLFKISGPDAPDYLHRMLSNEVKGLKPAEGRYQGLLDRKGMTLSLFYLKRLAEKEFLGVTPPQLTQKTLALLHKMKFIEKVAIAACDWELIFVMGPQAESLVSAKTADLLFWKEETFGIPFWNVCGPRSFLENFRNTVASQALLVGEEALQLVRMAAGFPRYGVDIDESHILLETPVPAAHQRNKGCYPGQEVIERISTYGKGRTPKRILPFALAGRLPIAAGSEIWPADASQAVGHVSSVAYDPDENKTRIMARVETKFLRDETRLQWKEDRLLIPLQPGPFSPATGETKSL